MEVSPTRHTKVSPAGRQAQRTPPLPPTTPNMAPEVLVGWRSGCCWCCCCRSHPCKRDGTVAAMGGGKAEETNPRPGNNDHPYSRTDRQYAKRAMLLAGSPQADLSCRNSRAASTPTDHIPTHPPTQPSLSHSLSLARSLALSARPS